MLLFLGQDVFHQAARGGRSEEHTSELQSQSNLVCRLLLEKKNTSRLFPPSLLKLELQTALRCPIYRHSNLLLAVVMRVLNHSTFERKNPPTTLSHVINEVT